MSKVIQFGKKKKFVKLKDLQTNKIILLTPEELEIDDLSEKDMIQALLFAEKRSKIYKFLGFCEQIA